MVFTDEQRRRMEENRARAQARLRQKRKAQSLAGVAITGGVGGGKEGVREGEAREGDSDGTAAPPPSSDGAPGPSGRASEPAERAAPTGRKLVNGPSSDEEPGSRPPPPPPAAAAASEPGLAARLAPARRSTRAGGGDRSTTTKISRVDGGGGDPVEGATDGARSVVCQECAGAENDLRVDKELLEGFGVTVCRTCKLKNEDYQCVTKKEAKETYLLPEGTIAVLKFIERDNPRHSSWTKMKLFLRRDVAEYSYKRWGGMEGLAAERGRRDSLKYDRTLAKTQDMFKRPRSQKERGASPFL